MCRDMRVYWLTCRLSGGNSDIVLVTDDTVVVACLPGEEVK